MLITLCTNFINVVQYIFLNLQRYSFKKWYFFPFTSSSDWLNIWREISKVHSVKKNKIHHKSEALRNNRGPICDQLPCIRISEWPVIRLWKTALLYFADCSLISEYKSYYADFNQTEERGVKTPYTQDTRSMLNYEYSSVFFVARKK